MATPSLTLRLCPVGCLCAGRLRQPAAPVKRQEASPLTIPSQTVGNWTLTPTRGTRRLDVPWFAAAQTPPCESPSFESTLRVRIVVASPSEAS